MPDKKPDLVAALEKSKNRAPGIPATQTFANATPAPAAPETAKEPTQRTTLDLPKSLHLKYKLRSITHGPNMADMITEAMRQYSEGWE